MANRFFASFAWWRNLLNSGNRLTRKRWPITWTRSSGQWTCKPSGTMSRRKSITAEKNFWETLTRLVLETFNLITFLIWFFSQLSTFNAYLLYLCLKKYSHCFDDKLKQIFSYRSSKIHRHTMAKTTSLRWTQRKFCRSSFKNFPRKKNSWWDSKKPSTPCSTITTR